MGFSSSFVKALIGAHLRSGPNDGNAKTYAFSFKEYASPRSLDAVNAPCPPLPCHIISFMPVPPSLFPSEKIFLYAIENK